MKPNVAEPEAGEIRRTISVDGGNCWEELRDGGCAVPGRECRLAEALDRATGGGTGLALGPG